MPSEQRWKQAQQYERSFWERAAQQIASGAGHSMAGTYRWKASQMEKHLDGLLLAERKPSLRVLEVGCGPVGIVSFIPWGERHALDPLNDYYAANPALSECRDPNVHYQKAMGEKIPYADSSFDLVLLENVLDHVQAAEQLLQEIHRVLTANGLFYMTVNVRRPWGNLLHSVLSALLIDRGHPYSFTATSIREFLGHERFRIVRDSLDDYFEARAAERRSPLLKDKIKGYTGLSEYVYYAVCSKEA